MKDSSRQPVSISAGTVFKIAGVVLLCYMAFVLRHVVLSVLAAVVIATALEPITRWFERRGIPRTLAVVLIYLGIVLSAASVFYLLVPVLIVDALAVIVELPRYAMEFLADIEPINAIITPFVPSIGSFNESIFFTASNLFGGVINFIFIAVVSFYLAAQRYGVTSFLRIVTPIRHEPYIIDLWNRSQRKIGRWMQGQVLLAVFIGVLTYIGLTILGFERALLLAVIAGFCELIPIFGPIIAAIPAIAFAFVDGGIGSAMLMLGMYVLIQQVESQIIHPLVVNKLVGIPPIVSIIALVVGGTLAGIIGLLIAVPVAAGVMEYLNDVERRKYA